ncbi:MAG: 1-deoxy-D-xylulose-5-phosphate reductoisomerase [Epulopiscium sp. Nuni2H_MBin001]|nr:MAG: 1-deoxy-D-xylulose-5-phosphate reductoisomerase [Epulopiscium sp. Nuni2H_MBin001]
MNNDAKRVLKRISILGSTGSIGTQALDVIDNEADVKVVALTTNIQIDLLEQQILKYKPEMVAVMDETKAIELKHRLQSKGINTEVIPGMEGLIYASSQTKADLVITAVVGMVGLLPTIEALKKGINIALANKETLVTAGDLVIKCAKESNSKILPVDSEHSAIFQCLHAGNKSEVSRLIITASGGAFRDFTKEQLSKVTVEQALKHPNWTMGSKITIDSATLMNKGLEVIEAKYLFNIANIDVVVHKESIIHSMVEFIDGSTIAQLGTPDMRHPIEYALNYPKRKNCEYIAKLDWTKKMALNFEPPKLELFPCLKLAYEALEQGGTTLAVLNAANEVAVARFLDGTIGFTQIPEVIHKVLEKHICIFRPSLEQILEADLWAREYCMEKVIK